MRVVDYLPHFVVIQNSHGTLSFQHGALPTDSGKLLFNTSCIEDPQSRLNWGDMLLMLWLCSRMVSSVLANGCCPAANSSLSIPMDLVTLFFCLL